jgi:c-di-GMP-binding flagellar brake protein YcgR
MMPSNGSSAIKTERRRHYRLSANLDAAMRAGLVLAHGTEHPGEVVDLSASGISLRWPIEQMVVIDEGQVVELFVQPLARKDPFAVNVAARWREPDGSGKVRYGFEFQHGADLPDGVAAALSRLFDHHHRPR